MDLFDRLAHAADTLDLASLQYRSRSQAVPKRRKHLVTTRVAAVVIGALCVAGLLAVRSGTSQTAGSASSSESEGVLPRLLLPERTITLGSTTYRAEVAGGQDYRIPGDPDGAFSYVSFFDGAQPGEGWASLTLRTGTVSSLGLPEQRLGGCSVSQTVVRGHGAIRIDDLVEGGAAGPSGVVFLMWQETPTVAALFEVRPSGFADALALANELEVVNEGTWARARQRMLAAGEFVTDPSNHDAIWSADGWFDFTRNDTAGVGDAGTTATTTASRGMCVLPEQGR